MLPNKTLDRYSDTTPYAETRVVLQTCSDSDYINASHLKYGHCHFIATQAPIQDETVSHFWRMVAEQEVKLIVALVKLEKRRCEIYWPEVGKELVCSDGDACI